MIPVGWLAPSADCWDSNMLRRLLDGTIYPHGLKFKHHAGFPNTDEGCVLVVPGQYWHHATDQINEAIKRFEWVLLVRTADEEDLFDVGALMHERIRYWVQTPRARYECWGDSLRAFGVGFPPHFNDLPATPPHKSTDVFLLCQDTHTRRHECFEALKDFPETVGRTEGFTQGSKPEQYTEWMVDTKVAPAPSGAVSVDSFRAFEALESHAIPIADTVSPVDGVTDYWRRVFDNPPFPILTDYPSLPGYISEALEQWPANANRIAAWWMRAKRHMAMALKADLQELGAL